MAAVAGDITYAKLRAANFSWRFQRQNAAKLDRRRQEIIPERNPRSIGRLFAKQCLGGSGLICWESMHRQHSIDFIASTPGQVWKKDAVSGDLSLASVDCLVVPRYYKLATVRLQVLNNLLVSWFSVGLRRAGRIVCRKSILVATGIRSFHGPYQWNAASLRQSEIRVGEYRENITGHCRGNFAMCFGMHGRKARIIIRLILVRYLIRQQIVFLADSGVSCVSLFG